MKKSLLAALLGSSLTLFPVLSFASIQMPHIEVSGTGEIDVTPDMANISVAVSVSKPTAKEAKDASDEAIASLLQRLNTMGISREDIKSANISLHAEYTYPKNEQPKLSGYKASRNVSVVVRDLNKLNSVLDGALTDGLNRINGIHLTSSQAAELQEQARSKAIEDAINKANALARGFNQEISGVWKINYNSYSPRPYMKSFAEASAGNALGYVDSKISIKDTVNVIFTINGNKVQYVPAK